MNSLKNMKISLISPSNFNQEIVSGFHLQYLICALREIDHRVYFSWDNRIINDSDLEIIFNPLLLIKFNKNFLYDLIISKRPFIIYSSELIRPDLSGYNFELRDDFNSEEKDIFLKICTMALQIWTMIGGPEIDIFGKVNRNVKHLKIGFTPSFSMMKKCRSPDWDILFYGSMSAHRKSILDGFEKTGLKIAVLGYGSEMIRDCFLSNTKIVLNINHGSHEIEALMKSQNREHIATGIFPYSTPRIIQCAHNSVVCVSDYAPLRDSYIERLFVPIKNSNLAETCFNIIKGNSWHDLGIENHSKLKNESFFCENLSILLSNL